jgi:glycosyltransferase involved in cell wall biosynthesis
MTPQVSNIIPSSSRPLVSSLRHIIHLSYTLARPKYTDPELWLNRVSFVSGIPENLIPYGPQTVIYNIHYKGEVQRNGVRFLFPGFRRWQLVLPFAFNNLVKSLKPDVIIVHGLIFPWQIIMLRMMLGSRLKIICQHHSERPFKDIRKYLLRWADKHTGAYLFASKTQGEEWVREKQIASLDKVHEIMAMSSVFKADLNRKRRGVYLWIGDLDENKDPLLMARAFAKFSKNRDVKLFMIYQQNQLEDQLRKIITPSIYLVGKVERSKLQDYFNEASYIISTSNYEGIGIAVCEALSCGCYPILTNLPSFRMMTDNGKIGKLFEAGNEDALVNALELTSDISEPDKIIDHFNANLSFEANARKIIFIIDTL